MKDGRSTQNQAVTRVILTGSRRWTALTLVGQRQYLWRTVDQDDEVIDILVQRRRDRRAAERFFRKLLKGRGCKPGAWSPIG